MAQYRIRNLNYMSSGSEKIAVEMDISRLNSAGLDIFPLVTEDGLSCFTSEDGISAVCADSSDVNADRIEELKTYNRLSDFNDRIFMISKNTRVGSSDSNVNTVNSVIPAYELEDIAFKQNNRTGQSTFPRFDSSSASKTEDIYVPQMSSQAMHFAQVGEFAYFMTRPTEYAPNYLSSDMAVTRKTNVRSSYYFGGIDQTKITPTYLYKRPDEIVENPYDPDFEPAATISGIRYNMMYSVDQNNSNSDYTFGNEYGQIYQLKNCYDATYSQNLCSETDIRRCRRYTGFSVSKNQIYLKYRDDVQYVADETGKAAAQPTTSFTYHKIENFTPNRVTNAARHKSNFYSVLIRNTKFSQTDAAEDDAVKEKYNRVKKDIANAVREITQNVCPVNTQLFEVRFTEN